MNSTLLYELNVVMPLQIYFYFILILQEKSTGYVKIPIFDRFAQFSDQENFKNMFLQNVSLSVVSEMNFVDALSKELWIDE